MSPAVVNPMITSHPLAHARSSVPSDFDVPNTSLR